MRDGSISISKAITLSLWTWTLLVLLAAWAALSVGRHDLFEAFGFTGCASSAVAATAQIRCYSLEVCRVLRANLAVSRPASERVPSIH